MSLVNDLDVFRFCASAVEYAKLMDHNWDKPMIDYLENAMANNLERLTNEDYVKAIQFKKDVKNLVAKLTPN